MFGFPKKNKLSKWTDELAQVSRRSSDFVSGQLSVFGEEHRTWSMYDDMWVARCVASYSWGVSCGMLQETGADRNWSVGRDIEELALLGVVAAVFGGVFGADRALEMQSSLFQAAGRIPPEDMALLERIGGEDAIAHLRGQLLEKRGGGLLHFLNHNAADQTSPTALG